MLIPVCCFTCGLPIDDRGELFLKMRNEKVKAIMAERGTVSTQAMIDSGLQIECEDILVKLGFDHHCCRNHLVTAMLFSDVY